MGIFSIETGDYRVIETGFSSHSRLSLTSDCQRVVCLAQSPVKFGCIIEVNLSDSKVILFLNLLPSLNSSVKFFVSRFEW